MQERGYIACIVQPRWLHYRVTTLSQIWTSGRLRRTNVAEPARGRAPARPDDLVHFDALNCMLLAASPLKKARNPFRNPGVEELTLEIPVIRETGPNAGV
jgi:hypothetical protein